MTTGQHRAAARLAAINERNAARAAAMPQDRVTRQQRRAAKRQPRTIGRSRRAFMPDLKIGPPDLFNSRILKTWIKGGKEYAFHATKGLRVRRK